MTRWDKMQTSWWILELQINQCVQKQPGYNNKPFVKLKVLMRKLNTGFSTYILQFNVNVKCNASVVVETKRDLNWTFSSQKRKAQEAEGEPSSKRKPGPWSTLAFIRFCICSDGGLLKLVLWSVQHCTALVNTCLSHCLSKIKCFYIFYSSGFVTLSQIIFLLNFSNNLYKIWGVQKAHPGVLCGIDFFSPNN